MAVGSAEVTRRRWTSGGIGGGDGGGENGGKLGGGGINDAYLSK